VLVHDALAMTWRTLRLAPDPQRAPVTAVRPVEGAPDREPSDDLPEVDAAELARRLRERAAGRAEFLLVDVREPDEHAAHAIPGAVLLPLADLLADPARLDGDGPLVLHCAGGGRSAQALRALLEQGRTDVVHLRGGIAAWDALGG